MKTRPSLALLACAALAPAFLLAQDAPPPPPAENNPRPQRGDGPDRHDRHFKGGRPEHGPGPDERDHDRGPRHEPEMQPRPYLGLMTKEVGPEVAAHTGLKPGFGLLVVEVMKDSPAEKAGVQQHDIIVLLGDQKIVNTEQLSTLVRGEGKDAEVSLTVRRGGAEQKLTVKIAEKMMPSFDSQRGPHGSGFYPYEQGMKHFFGPDQRERMERFGREMQERGKEFQDRMKDYQERLQDWMRGPKDRPQPTPPQMRGGPPDHAERREEHREHHQQKAITRRDDTGEYKLHEDDGKKVFTMKLKGEEKEQRFEINNAEDRAKLPAPVLQKLEELERMSKQVPAGGGRPPETDRKPSDQRSI
jgi:hypothetical protein